MKSISQFKDLEAFGIIPLTGESDALSFRILCDLTPKGKKIVQVCLGLRSDTAFEEPWNSRQGQVASCLISPDFVPSLGVIALVQDGAHTVFSSFHTHGNEQDGFSITTQINGLYGANEWYRHGTGHMDENDNWVNDNPIVIAFEGYELPITDCAYRFGKIGRMFRLGNGPHVGTRNVHAMSGRVV